MIEPIIDMDKFKQDYNAGLSAKDIKEKYKLTPRQYRRILTDNELTRDYSFLKKNNQLYHKLNATYYSRIGNRYVIRKVFGSKTITYGGYLFEEEAKHIVDGLKKADWNKRKLKKIIRDMKKEEWHINLYNEKIRSIRQTIEFEEMKDKPNYEQIRKLKKELRMLLKEADL